MPPVLHRFFLTVIASCAALAGTSFRAQAQTGVGAFPIKPIRVIVPAAPADSCDVLTRLVTPKMTERLGQAFVVDNRVGASGALGASA